MFSEILNTLIVMVVLILANGFFSAAEIAVVSIRRSKVKHLIEEGHRNATSVERLHKQIEEFLATVQIGVTFVGAFGAALGGASVAEPVADLIKKIPIPLIQGSAGQIGLGVVVVIYSFMSILLGELVPKSLALRYSEFLALRLARPLLWLGSILRPVVWFFTVSANLILWPFKDRTSFTETRLTAEEIKLLVGEAAESGAIEAHGAEIIERAVDFGELTAADVLIPRPQIVAIDLKSSTQDIQRILLEEGHTRMPVIDGNFDKVVGYVTAKDILSLVGERQLIVLKDIIRPAFFVPTTMRAIELLRALQKRHEHLAIVVDEYGGTAGLCTTEDLVEEIVGDLFSEDQPGQVMIQAEPQGTSLLSAVLPVREFNRAFDAHIPEHEAYDTLAGLLTHLAGVIPQNGQVFVIQGFEFTVIERTERRVKQVRVRRLVV